MRVFSVSDLHTDYKDNLAWVERLCSGGEHAGDALIVAGDVSDDIHTFTKTFELLSAAYGHVFFTPGNHDLWCRKEERHGGYDSLGKLALLRSVCARLGVRTEPACVGGVWVVPLLSWYHASWDREPDVPGSMPIEKVMLDFHACKWTSAPGLHAGDDSLAAHFDALNDSTLGPVLAALAAAEAAGAGRPPVISASHFLPHQELLPEKRMLFQPNLAKASGSDYLRARVQALRPLVHVFGHTHFSWDASLGGVRYVQWPLGYPPEQRRRRDGGAGWAPLLVYDAAAGGVQPGRGAYWSDYYAANRRDPGNVTPAPWVKL